MKRRAALCLLFSGVLWLTGCTGGTFNAASTQSQSAVIQSVSVSCNPASLVTGQTTQCSATVSGTGSYSSNVDWTAAMGTITASGVYTAPNTVPPSGLDTITATSKQDIKKSGSGALKVNGQGNQVNSVSVVAMPASILLGQTSTCTATVSGNGNISTGVTWSATGGSITQAGVFTPSSTGTGTCTATSTQDGTKSGTASVSVGVASAPLAVTGIAVVPSPSSINTTQTSICAAAVTGTGAYSNGVTWTATGGTITQAGVFTPSGTGTGSCTATSMQPGFTNMSGTAAISITNAPPTVTSIAVIANPSTITTAQTSTCVANVKGTGAFSTGVTWSATGGTITQSGVFTPSGTGTGTCKATSTQAGFTNISGSASINVTSVPFTITSVSVSATPSSINTGQTSQCAATVSGTGSYSSAVTWTATGGTISSTGLLTPSGAGTATCKANSSVTGYTNIAGSANISVASAGPTITAVTLVCTPSSITTAQTASCTPTVTGTGSFTNTVNLSLSPSGGSLSSSTGVASGTASTFTPPSTAETATITATSTQDATKTASATVVVTSTSGSGAVCGSLSLGNMGSLNGFVPFPSTNAWNTDISNAPVDPNNSTIAGAFSGIHLHPDFASSLYGIPYVVVDSSTQPLVSVANNSSEGDTAFAPVPISVPIEGGPADCTSSGDQHTIVIDRNTCMAYENYNTVRCNGQFTSDGQTIWDLKNYEQRPWGWSSADAAGLPIFAGLVRYDEVASGAINHAIRFTMHSSKSDSNGGYFVQPASHAAGTASTSPYVMGMRVRLKASFDISGFSATNQVILTAMKKYGMILADNGSDFYFQGTPDPHWNDNDLGNLKNITSDNFEVIQMTPTYPGWDANTAPGGAAPTINSFTASASTVAAGSAVTLTWSTANDSYDFIDKLGGVHGPSVTITPTATTTYTLNATNQYGRTTKQVTVVVQ